MSDRNAQPAAMVASARSFPSSHQANDPRDGIRRLCGNFGNLSSLLLLLTAAAPPPRTVPLGADLQRFAYPYPVRSFPTRSGGRPVRIAFMDVRPTGRSVGRVAVLLHGKNFCAATWGDTARLLSGHGWRVVVPDLPGFCKSSKPAGLRYTVAGEGAAVRALLASLRVRRPVLIGHSTGGLVAMRWALDRPDTLAALVLVNPLGLNDTIAQGVPFAGLTRLRADEAKTDAASIMGYQVRNYYHGTWRPAYDRWVAMLAGQYAGPGGARVREAQARLSLMIEQGPVASELDRLVVPTTLLIGQADRTAFRASSAPPAVRARIAAVPAAAEAAAPRMHARLVRLAGLGHAPQVEDPARFGAALLAALDQAASAAAGNAYSTSALAVAAARRPSASGTSWSR